MIDPAPAPRPARRTSRDKALAWLDDNAEELLTAAEEFVPPMILRGMRPLLESKLRGALEAASPEELDAALESVMVWLSAFLSDPEPEPADAPAVE